MRLHRFLSGRKEAPLEEWWIGRLCDEFKVLPTEAAREWRRAPDLVIAVLKARHYAHWFHRLMSTEDDTDWPAEGKEPMADLVIEMHAAYLQAQKRRRQGETSCE